LNIIGGGCAINLSVFGLNQFRPHLSPVVPKVTTSDRTIRLLLDTHAQLTAKSLFSAASFAHIAFRSSASLREIRARVLVEAVEVGDELVHCERLPYGNVKSIPFGDLPFGN
jgi:hypothetical protein